MMNMDVKVNVIVPARRGNVSVEFSWPAGYQFLHSEEDTDGGRYVIAFFAEAPEARPDMKAIATHIMHDPDARGHHSVTGLAIANSRISGRDRKIVRSGSIVQ